ncbi:monovalent cation/H+ antiporter subunit D [Motiliproteus sediminis]|uniref:monovalent cation/H+ antiporter subunit D n=1 Tax=Motiliproteus sediminis TaxID=1468178 RepID=UPI001AF01BB6|nr:monovalent cation/H+ antiporter subunit D [Motiliproteus sediminis]
MNHSIIFPVLIPLLIAILQLLPPLSGRGGLASGRLRASSLFAVGLVLVVAVYLLLATHSGAAQIYRLGDWQPPFGIVLVADRLAALMLLVTAVLALGALLYACAGDDHTGVYFHPLFLFQLAGINAAFLTGDLFNLFVAFEILLIASYALLIHGGGKARTRVAVGYVILNLVGSTVFLFALGILYGVLGTLNMADMAVKIRHLSSAEQAIASTGGLLLLVVFGLKSAMLPLQFWLPATYAAASAPVAALFAILTKVGIYSMLRVFGLIFGPHAGALADLIVPWLWPLAVLSLLLAAVGIMAAVSLRQLIGQLILLSIGTLLAAMAINNTAAVGAALYYLVHSTLICGALFLLADIVVRQRGKAEDRFVQAQRMCHPGLLGTVFFVAALSVVGLPPLSGFVGKALMLNAAETSAQISWLWPPILLGGLASLVALSRAGSTLFWRISGEKACCEPVSRLQLAAVLLLLSASPLLVLFGGPVTGFTGASAEQLALFERTPQLLLPQVSP